MKTKTEVEIELKHLKGLLPNTGEKIFVNGMIVALEWILS